MPFVVVEMWEGKEQSQKKQLVKGITDEFEKIGVPRQAVQIILKENPKSNWAIAGTMSSEK